MAPLLKIMGWQVAKVCFKPFCSFQSLQGACVKDLLTDSQLFLPLIQLLDQQWFCILDSLSQDLQLWYSSDININLTHAVNYTCIWICGYVYQSKHAQYRDTTVVEGNLSSVSAVTDAVTAVWNSIEMAFWFTERDSSPRLKKFK